MVATGQLQTNKKRSIPLESHQSLVSKLLGLPSRVHHQPNPTSFRSRRQDAICSIREREKQKEGQLDRERERERIKKKRAIGRKTRTDRATERVS